MADEHYVFPELPWFQELAARLNDIPQYVESSENWQGLLVIHAKPQPGVLDHDVAVSLDPTGGTITDVHMVDDIARYEADYVLSAPYNVWKDVIVGKHDILFGLMRGKIRLRGQVFKLMLQLKTPKIMLDAMRAMPTRFLDE